MGTMTDHLPPPFAWIDIPSGHVTITSAISPIKTERVAVVPPFAISKYPITNAQYARFVEAGGYQQTWWWTTLGWQARTHGWAWNGAAWAASGRPWTEPRYWHVPEWNRPNQPVVGVSWFEAHAYCQWLGGVTGTRIMLPTEQQWQRAAQGDDERIYPWGHTWNGECCHHAVAPRHADHPAPVTAYEALGASPFGVVDMAGNVWEWTGSAHGTTLQSLYGSEVRCVRGGAWHDTHQLDFSVTYRTGYHPNYAGNDIGFRCVRLLDENQGT